MTFSKSLIRILVMTSFVAFCFESKLKKTTTTKQNNFYIPHLCRLKCLAENLLHCIAVCRVQRIEKKEMFEKRGAVFGVQSKILHFLGLQ